MAYALVTDLGSKKFSKHASASASDEAEYDRLRALAHAAHARRNECFERSRAAYAAGDGAAAKQLSTEGKRHDAEGDALHLQARDFIFRANNAQRASDEIDLHGLYVQEAETVLRTRIQAERARGNPGGLHVIVGKGNHSTGGVQKIKPAVEALCRELGLQYSTEQNAGRIYIDLSGGSGSGVGEVPAAQHPYKPSKYINRPQQGGGPHHGGAGGYPGQQQQHHNQQQQQQGGGGVDLEGLAREHAPTLIKKLAGCCIVM